MDVIIGKYILLDNIIFKSYISSSSKLLQSDDYLTVLIITEMKGEYQKFEIMWSMLLHYGIHRYQI